VRPRSFASVHGVSVVYLWSVHHFPNSTGYGRSIGRRLAVILADPSPT
jgi:hypothetical protein